MGDATSDLRALREGSNHSQVQVAKFLGVAQTVVSQWEGGSAPLPDGHVTLMSKIFGVTPDEVSRAAEVTRDSWLAERDMRLARTLRRLRDSAELSRAQVAEACDCTANAVVLWENGTSRPSRGRLSSLAELLGLDPQELLQEANFDDNEIAGYLDSSQQERTALADLLRERRKEAGLSQTQVAAALDYSQNGVSAIETSVHLPNPELLAGMARLYDIDRLEVVAARYETRRELGHIPEVALPWPLRPTHVPRVRWFRQLRAHLGSTRDELAEALDVGTAVIRDAERIETAGLPKGLRPTSTLTQLAEISGCRLEDVIAAWEPDAVDLAPLLALHGQELVVACESVAQLLRLLHFRGTTWTRIGEVTGTSRQSPIYWAEGTIPQKSRVVAMGSLFDPPVPDKFMEELWSRSKDAGSAGHDRAAPEATEVPEPRPGTPDWIFAEERLRVGKGED